MFCGKCGRELPDNAKFCDACGNKIINSFFNEQTVQENNLGMKKKLFFRNTGLILLGIISLEFIISMIKGYEEFTDWANTYDAKWFIIFYLLVGLGLPLVFATGHFSRKKELSLKNIALGLLLLIIGATVFYKIFEESYLDNEEIYLLYSLVGSYLESVAAIVFKVILAIGAFICFYMEEVQSGGKFK